MDDHDTDDLTGGDGYEPTSFSDYVAGLREDQGAHLVNQLTVGLGTLSKIVRPQHEESPTVRVAATLATVYATLREAQLLLHGALPETGDHPFLPQTEDRLAVPWRTLTSGPSGRSLINGLLAASAAARQVGRIASADGDVNVVRGRLLAALRALIEMRDGLITATGPGLEVPSNAEQGHATVPRTAVNAAALDQLQRVAAAAWERLQVTRWCIERSYTTLALVGARSGRA